MPVNTRRVTQFGQSIELADESAVLAATLIDTATGNPVPNPLTNTELRASPVPVSGTVTASGPLTNAELRASPVPVSGTVTASGPLTDAQLRATPVPISGTVTATGSLTNAELRASPLSTSLVGSSTDITKVQSHALWTDGTTDGSSGGAATLSGNFSVTPRVVYITAPVGGIRITSIRFWIFAGSALNSSGWGTGAPALTNGVRVEVVTATPTDPATVPVWRLYPSGSSNVTLLKSNYDFIKASRWELIGSRWNQNIACSIDLPEGGLPIAAGSSFRVVAQDDTSSATGFRAEVTYGPL